MMQFIRLELCTKKLWSKWLAKFEDEQDSFHSTYISTLHLVDVNIEFLTQFLRFEL